ncbi:hypothetical protein G6M89_11165 [Natronolimnobius sp. AArcel1]|uniref:hypothetical protein n=1 Tax=Natronolimnobius sp. AArcel1 TaxID=1679093 RepID=UPI0013E9B493|nr:hypothetical protein [Natronolimnobius sp. AArcel1]NGM69557.1 hypothetical protein [Natronolimnobius sp. AArcel1]
MAIKVSQSTGYVPNLQMSAFGYVMGVVLLIIMLPALPILIPAYVVWRVFFADEPTEETFETWRTDANRYRPQAPQPDEPEDEDDD